MNPIKLKSDLRLFLVLHQAGKAGRALSATAALAVWRKTSEQTAFSLEDRRALSNIFFQPVRMDGAEMLLLDAVKKQMEQLRVFYLKLRDDIPLPYFPEGDRRG